MVYEYWLYDKNLQYIETVYMTPTEFNEYFTSHKRAAKYSMKPADDNFQNRGGSR